MLGARFLPRTVFRGGALALVAAAVVMTSLLWAGGSPASAQNAQKPAKPTGLSVATEQGSLDVSVDWDDTSGATSYKVQWRVSDPGNPLNTGITATSSSADITVAKYGDWIVRVKACNDNGCGDPVSKGFTTIAAQTIVPPAPTGLTVSAGTNAGELDAIWTAPSGTVTDYDLRYYAGSADPTDEADWVEEGEARGLPNPGTSTSATISRLKTDTVYRVQVRAASAVGEGAWSDSASARIDTTAPVLRIARVSSDGTELTLYYDDPLDSSSAPAHGRFSVTVDGSKRTLSGGGTVTVYGSRVTMNLGTPAVKVDQAVTLSYDAAAAAKPIKNLKGIEAPGISGLAAINDRIEGGGISGLAATDGRREVGGKQSEVETPEIVSTPSNDTNSDGTKDTYGAGAEIKVRHTFDENVTVDTWGGRPRLKIKLHADHSNTKWAVYEGGSGTAALTFSYTVKSGDTSSNGTTDNGIAVLANSLDENGAWILSAATGRFVNTAHAGLDHNAGHKVNGTLDGKAPRFKRALVNQTTLIITFGENLDTSSVPAAGRFCVDTTTPDGSARSFCGASGSNVSINTGNNALVTVPLSIGVRSGETVKLSYTKPDSGYLQDAAGNAVASFSGKRVTNYSKAPGQPTGVWASATSLGGSLNVNWTAPDSGATPTGYELRYYQGTADPPAGREADWKEDVAGLPDPGAAVTSATIQGLRANTAYRVQVRAKTAAEGGPWSTSASAITGSPSAGNNPPRVLREISPFPASGNVCEVVNISGPIKRAMVVPARGGVQVSEPNLVARNDGDTTAWPSICNTGNQNDRRAPVFDDVDGDKLTVSVDPHPLPANVRVTTEYYFLVHQKGELTSTDNGRVWFQGQAAFRETAPRAVRGKLTATDPHGTSVSVRVSFLVSAVVDVNGAPTLPEVEDLDASPVRKFSHVLPAATGGDLFFYGPPQYYYAISGLPEGLSFDPETRTISGTPSETGSFSVTYTADDPDTVGSAYLNPETPNDDTKNINDTASRTFTINVRPFVGLVRVSSAPTHDANGDGKNDTYGEGDKIAVDVEFVEPVKFDPGTGTTEKNTVEIPPLRVGRDSDTSAGTLKTAELTDVLNGGKTLRFQYTVQRGDNDPDGVSIGSFSGDDEDKMLVLKGTATLTGLVSEEATSLKRADYHILGNAVDENGLPLSYVNGYLNSAGPKPTAAHVDGETLTVTFDEDLAALSAAELQSLTFLFGVQGADGTGGNRNAYQHPSSVAMRTDNRTLELTLGVAARAGETITLSYKLNNYVGPIEDTDGNMAPAFVHLMVTNNTGGAGGEGAVGAAGAAGAGGTAAEAEVTLVSNTGQSTDTTNTLNNDQALTFATGSNTPGYNLTSVVVPYSGSVPAASGHTIKIHASNSSNRPGDSLGTLAYGTVSGTTVTYTASGEGILLDAGTTYFVVLDAVTGSLDASVQLTGPNSEDSAKADGWSLGDRGLWKLRSTTTWNTHNAVSWKIAIHGVVIAGPPPQPQLASVAGTKLKIVFDKALDDTSTESGKHFTVSMSDRDSTSTIKGTAADVAISEKTVTVTLAEAVPPNVAAQVTYDPPTLSLKADDDNTYVAGFLGFKIETVYDTAVPVLTQAGVAQTSKNPDGFRVALYYDEALDPDSVPATTDFSLTLDSNAAVTPNAVAVEENTVLLTVDLAKAPTEEAFNVTYSKADVSYTKGTNPIRDPAGNEAAAFTGLEQTTLKAKVDVEAAGTPAVVTETVTVTGDAVTLVGNTGQSNDDTHAFTVDTVQEFTTGSNAGGYRLTSVTVPYSGGVPDAATHSMWIASKGPTGFPLSGSVGVLTYGSVSGTTVTYNASDGGIDLEPDTSYFVYLNSIGAGSPGVSTLSTDSDNEDAGAAVAWTLADTASTFHNGWNSRDAVWQIAIQGTAVTPVTLVSNTGQSEDVNNDFTLHIQQKFTTGSNTGGYRLTSVSVPYTGSAPAASSHDIVIYLHASGGLGTKLGTLSYGSVSGTTVTYTASGAGISLAAGTDYVVLFDPLATPSGSQLRATNSGNEDAGGADGWSLSNASWTWAGPGHTTTTRPGVVWQIAIDGVVIGSGGGTTEKTVYDLAVDGSRLTVTYDKSLDPASLPDPDRFTLLYEDDIPVSGVVAVAVAGKQLVLTLNGAVSPCAPAFTLSYSWSETEKNIRTFTGHEAPDIEAAPVLNAQADRCVNGRVVVQNDEGASGNSGGGSGQGKQGKSLTVKFDRPLDMGKALKASAFGLAGASGGAAPAIEEAAYAADGAGVALTLARGLGSGETVTLSYTRPAGQPGLWTAAGDQIADFSGVAVPVRTSGAPSVTGVEVVSDAGSDDTYALGETVRVRVTFSEAVEVDTEGGTPRLAIDMDPAHWGTKWAAYESGSGTESLTFAHTVVEPNESTRGIAMLANTLQANGGTIRSSATGTDAAFAHMGLGHDPAHKVNWRLAPAANDPATGAPAIAGTAQVGATLTADTSGISDADGLDNAVFSYQWLADDVDISGATGSTYTLAAADEGKAVKLKVSFTDDAGNDETLTSEATAAVAAAAVENSPAAGAPMITGTARVGETLTARTTHIADGDGLTNATFSYQWLADDADISGATGSTYTLAAADEGKAVKVKASFTDDAGNAESLTSDATSAVVAALPPPAPTNLVVSDNGNGTLTLTWHAPDDDGVTGYQILRRRPNEGESTLLVHVVDTGSTDTTWTDGDVTMGTRHVYRVKAINDAGLSQMSNLARATPTSPPENNAATGVATITGTAQVGETLTADTSGISDVDGLDNAVFSYQWLADDVDISGATSSTYTLAATDEGKAVKAKVSFTDDAGNDETLTSEATAAVVAAPLTVSIENEATSHDGSSSFTFELRFSEEVKIGYEKLRDHAFTLTGGEVVKAQRLDKPSNIRWQITVTPDSNADVTVTLPVTTDCDAQGAICTKDGGRPLSNTVSVTVQGPE